MTQDEMQRFLDLEAIRGLGELEAYRNLMQVIGISFHKRNKEAEEQDNNPKSEN